MFSLQVNPDIVLTQCRRCRASQASRFPTDSALLQYYKSYFASPDDRPRVTTGSPQRLGLRIASYLGDLASRDQLEILDFGGGDGSNAVAVLEARGMQGAVTVIDHEQRLAPSPPGISVRRTESLDKLDDDFDVVLASAVLEHLPNPLDALGVLLARVRPGGVFYARTPYIVPIMDLACRVGKSFDFTFPAHLYDLGQPFWDALPTWYQPASKLQVLASKPSPVETSFRDHPGRTLIAGLMKAPYRLIGPRWPWTGGWEWAACRQTHGCAVSNISQP